MGSSYLLLNYSYYAYEDTWLEPEKYRYVGQSLQWVLKGFSDSAVSMEGVEWSRLPAPTVAELDEDANLQLVEQQSHNGAWTYAYRVVTTLQMYWLKDEHASPRKQVCTIVGSETGRTSASCFRSGLFVACSCWPSGRRRLRRISWPSCSLPIPWTCWRR